jgi:hypothetical protein
LEHELLGEGDIRGIGGGSGGDAPPWIMSERPNARINARMDSILEKARLRSRSRVRSRSLSPPPFARTIVASGLLPHSQHLYHPWGSSYSEFCGINSRTLASLLSLLAFLTGLGFACISCGKCLCCTTKMQVEGLVIQKLCIAIFCICAPVSPNPIFYCIC